MRIDISDKEKIIQNILKVAKGMSTFEFKLLELAIAGLNDAFNNWDELNEADQNDIRESLLGILLLSEQGEQL